MLELNRLRALSSILVLLVLAGCGPAPMPSPTSVVPASPTAVISPSPTAMIPLSPTPVPPTPVVPVLPTVPPPLPTPAPSISGDPRFGAVFFSTKLNITDLPCAELQKMGVHSTFFGAWWGLLEPQNGQYDWGSVDGPVDAALACGVEPVIKITTAAGPGKDAMPPEDIEAYSNFVFELAQHLKGRVRVYAIENELDNQRMAGWTAEVYAPVRAAAYQAIHRADADAWVLDCGLTMGAYLMARADELRQAGRAEEAVAMLGRFQQFIRRKEASLPDSEKRLSQWLGSPNALRSVDLVKEMVAHPETYDAVQLHYLQDAWELIPEYIGWVRSWQPDKQVEFWEIGFGWEGEQFTEKGHANGVVKTLVSALGEGAGRVIYEPYWEQTGANAQAKKFGRGLMTPDGSRLAATAYQTMASQLSGYQKAERLDVGPGVWAYRFVTPRGDVYVVWANSAGTVRLPLPATQVVVTDITGSTTTATAASLPVSTSPVFVSAGE